MNTELADVEYTNWANYFLDIAEVVSKKSKDPSTKIGVVIVGPNNEIRSTGFNGFPRGVYDRHTWPDKFGIGVSNNRYGMLTAKFNQMIDERYERPMKYTYTEHGERNAIFHAARNGNALDGCIMFINSYPIPCTDCTRAVIQAGIKKVIGTDVYVPKGSHWEEDMTHAKRMLNEAGVGWTIIPHDERDVVFTFDNGENNA